MAYRVSPDSAMQYNEASIIVTILFVFSSVWHIFDFGLSGVSMADHRSTVDINVHVFSMLKPVHELVGWFAASLCRSNNRQRLLVRQPLSLF